MVSWRNDFNQSADLQVLVDMYDQRYADQDCKNSRKNMTWVVWIESMRIRAGAHPVWCLVILGTIYCCTGRCMYCSEPICLRRLELELIDILRTWGMRRYLSPDVATTNSNNSKCLP